MFSLSGAHQNNRTRPAERNFTRPNTSIAIGERSSVFSPVCIQDLGESFRGKRPANAGGVGPEIKQHPEGAARCAGAVEEGDGFFLSVMGHLHFVAARETMQPHFLSKRDEIPVQAQHAPTAGFCQRCPAQF